jgi:hypothetical protein
MTKKIDQNRYRACLFIGAFSALSIFSNSPAYSAPGIVLGDSIGVGVSMASGLRRLARNSVSIRSSNAIAQIRRAPRDVIAFLSLGTNDAVGSIAGVSGGIDRIIDAADRAGIHLVWIGPPCVLKPWNRNVEKLDAVLKQKLAGRVTYVSIADQQICNRNLRAADGVHFTMGGYEILWARARAAAGAPIDAKVAAADPTLQEHPKKHLTRRSHQKKRDRPADRSQAPNMPADQQGATNN